MIDIAQDAELAGAKFKEAAAPYAKDKLEQRIAQADLAAESALHTALWNEMAQPEIGPCGECSKDYLVPCPKGWSMVAGDLCQAPEDYLGPCLAFAALKALSAKDKMQYETQCDACWPCANEGAHAEAGALRR